MTTPHHTYISWWPIANRHGCSIRASLTMITLFPSFHGCLAMKQFCLNWETRSSVNSVKHRVSPTWKSPIINATMGLGLLGYTRLAAHTAWENSVLHDFGKFGRSLCTSYLQIINTRRWGSDYSNIQGLPRTSWENSARFWKVSECSSLDGQRL